MITKIIELSCDHEGCGVAYYATPAEMTSLRRTRIGSMIAGWSHVGGRDYCPSHAAPAIDAIRELVAKRLTDAQIAEQVGMHRATVQKLRAAHGIRPGLGRVGRPSHGSRGAS